MRRPIPPTSIRPGPAARRVGAALAASSAVACSSWQARPAPGPGAPAPAGPVRVTLTDGRALVLARPAVARDSLVGEAGSPPARRAVALREVARVEERRPSPARSLGLGWLVLNALAGVALVAYLAG